MKQATQTITATLWELRTRARDLLVAGEMLKEHSTLDAESPEDYGGLWDETAEQTRELVLLIERAYRKASI